jgi:4-hydroxybenzoyl-CoA thioesterase
VLINKREIHIEWGDCDPAGIVYFPRYFEYGDACASALFERAGLPKRKLLETYGLIGIPLVDARARFLAPSRFGDTIAVESRIAEWGRSSFMIEHKMFRGDVLAVEIVEKRVWTVRAAGAAGAMQSQPVPEEVKARFSEGADLSPK